jgi:hypothetical protein
MSKAKNNADLTVILYDTKQGDEGRLYFNDVTPDDDGKELTVWHEELLIARFSLSCIVCWYYP